MVSPSAHRMFRVAALWLAAFVPLIVGLDRAHAHSPYFTQIETAALPDGQTGEMRLLHGDGIFFSDPVRLLLLDAQGRIVARSHETDSMVILCDVARQCRAFDGKHSLMLEPDPATFRPRAVAGTDTYDYWDNESATASWGFHTRNAALSEIVMGNLALARAAKSDLVVLAILGALAAFVSLFGLWGPGRSLGARILWGVILAVRGFAGVILVLASLYWIALTGLNGKLWLLSMGFGGAIVIAADLWIFRRKPAPP